MEKSDNDHEVCGMTKKRMYGNCVLMTKPTMSEKLKDMLIRNAKEVFAARGEPNREFEITCLPITEKERDEFGREYTKDVTHIAWWKTV